MDRIQGANSGVGFRGRIQGSDSGIGLGERILGSDPGVGFIWRPFKLHLEVI